MLYSILRVARSEWKSDQPVSDKMFAVFRPEIGRDAYHTFIRRGENELRLDARGDFGHVMLISRKWTLTERPVGPASGVSVFVPAAEVLSIYPGFVSAYERRELSFDETFRDLCVDLSASPLRSVSPPALAEAADRLDEVVGGKTVLRGDRFYVSLAEDWMLEAPMLAEGLRKLAAIAHLIRNGSIAEKGSLFWDEPETNMNPKLIPIVARTLLALAGAGVQVFVATHDYLLTNELSVAAEYQMAEAKAAKLKFFCLGHAKPGEPVTIQSGDVVADLAANPILEEFAAHYEREQKLFAPSAPSEE
jgi:hypothetical protein